MTRFAASLFLITAPAVAQLVYPYSLVPGGIATNAEWRQHRSDPVYRGYRLADSVHVAQTRRPILRYVSFDSRGVLEWTDHQIVIGKHELVLVMDGEIRLRGRCGNLLATVAPPAKVSTPFVPPDIPMPMRPIPLVLELPPYLPLMPDWSLPVPAPMLPPRAPDTPVSPLPVRPGGGGGALAPPVWTAIGAGGLFIAGRDHDAIAAAAAPEPGTWMLAMTGVSFVAWRNRRWMK